MARIALDAMGGDFAPTATIAGALLALDQLGDIHTVQLVGQTAVIEEQLAAQLNGELAHCAHVRHRISIVEASDNIGMAERPTAALRKKPNNPMAVGIKMQVDGESDAFVSAGNTGAQMAVSAVMLGLHAGLKRPPVCTILPTSREPIVFLDSGANVDCSALELLQFAWCGSVYAETVLERPNPVVGLLSIGEEESKGNAISKEAYALFGASGFNFQGNIEGRDVPAAATHRGPVDVVVCDGFTGNIVLKFYEGVIPMVLEIMKRDPDIDMLRVKKALSALDSSVYGGAPLLGVRGISMICHGNSTSRAIKNAIGAAVRAFETKMNDRIGEKLAQASQDGEAERVAS